jgi:hypothetical protein
MEGVKRTLLMLLLVVAPACGGEPSADTREPEQHVPPAARQPKAAVLGPSPFVPKTEQRGDRDILPLTFPDGTHVALSYPAGVRLAELGVQPDVSLQYRGRAFDQYPLTFLYDVEDRPAASDEIAVPAGPWTVVARVADSDVRRDISRSLSARETVEGFVVVETARPHTLSDQFGEGGGVQLAFGDGDPAPSRVTTLDPLIIVAPVDCGRSPDTEVGGSYGSACLGGRIHVSIYGERAFVEAVLSGLEVERLRPAEK